MYLGIDIGSVSIKYAIIDKNLKVLESGYFRTKGDVINSLKNLLKQLKTKKIQGIGTTGSARKLVKELVSADIDVDEITAHRTAVKALYPEVKTIFEIGGQDSKLIVIDENSINFEMNNVCAAGTGSFLDQQASRLGMPIEEFCKTGLSAEKRYKIASKCTVFAETDMIHAQQTGIPIPMIIRGIHKGLIDNYFSQLCRDKRLSGKFLFEGGASENPVLIDEFANKLLKEGLIASKDELIVPNPHNKVMGAIGAAIFCRNKKIDNTRAVPKINNFEFLDYASCNACHHKCGADIARIKVNDKIITTGKQCQT